MSNPGTTPAPAPTSDFTPGSAAVPPATPAFAHDAVPAPVSDNLPVVDGDVPIVLPTDDKAKVETLRRLRQDILQNLAVKLKHGRNYELTTDEHTRLRTFLRYLRGLPMTASLQSEASLDRGLALVYDSNRFRFASEYVALALAIRDEWDAQLEAEKRTASKGVAEAGDGAAATSPRKRKRRLQGAASAPASATRTTTTTTAAAAAVVRLPGPDHLIFGQNGIMRGILVRNDQRMSYLFDQNFVRADPKAFGHNGVAVNAWWPRQICALRDGAHGDRTAGISGSIEHGAYSIVVASAYAWYNEDHGDRLLYSGSDVASNEDPNTVYQTARTQILSRSVHTGRPVRVLRTSTGSPRYAPRVGIRYDGLYRATREFQALNQQGGLYSRFELIREPNQPAIDHDVPSAHQRFLETRVADGY